MFKSKKSQKKSKRSFSALINEGKHKIIRWPVLYYPGISNELSKMFRNFSSTFVYFKSNNLKDFLGNPKNNIGVKPRVIKYNVKVVTNVT